MAGIHIGIRRNSIYRMTEEQKKIIEKAVALMNKHMMPLLDLPIESFDW